MSAPLVPFPDIPAGLPVIEPAPAEDTTYEDTVAAAAAWKAAHEAIMAAWQVTPEHMLRTRMSIRRGEFNQGIAAQAALAMLGRANSAVAAMQRHRYSREAGYTWAAATDAEAARQA